MVNMTNVEPFILRHPEDESSGSLPLLFQGTTPKPIPVSRRRGETQLSIEGAGRKERWHTTKYYNY
jgi:hypothetical protein